MLGRGRKKAAKQDETKQDATQDAKPDETTPEVTDLGTTAEAAEMVVDAPEAVEPAADDASDVVDIEDDADSAEAQSRLVQAKAELAKAEAELAKIRLAEAEAELARAEKAARAREKARSKGIVTSAAVKAPVEYYSAETEPRKVRFTRTRAIVLIGVLTALVVGLGATSIVMLWQTTAMDAKENNATSAQTAAAAAAQDFSSYDYRTLDSNFKTAAGEATGTFLKQYQQTTQQLKQTAVQQQAVVVGTVLKSGVEQVGADQAVVVVFVNQQTSKAGQDRGTDQYRLRLTLVKQGSRWLVSNLQAL